MTLKSQKQLYQFLESIICGEDVKTKEEMSMDDDIVTSEYDSKISEYADFIDDVEEVTVDECFMDDINNDNLYLQDHRSSEAVKDNIINIDDTDTAVIFTLGVNSTENEFQLLSPDKVYVCDETDTEMISGINYDCSNDDQFGNDFGGRDNDGKEEEDEREVVEVTVEELSIEMAANRDRLSNRSDGATSDHRSAASTVSADSRENSYRCDICRKPFETDLSMVKHMKSEHGKYKCLYCDKSFDRASTLSSHKYVHRPDRDYPCSECRFAFKTKSDLNTHIKRVHLEPTDDQMRYCQQCPFKTKTRMKLKLHMLTHTGRYLFYCDQCGKGFNNTLGLQTHKNNHIGLKPYQCDVCGKKFTREPYMKQHQRTLHQKPYSFECALCSRKFSFKCSLNTHLKREHYGQKPSYRCEFCDKAVSSKFSLENHRRLHFNLKPFTCAECGKSFRTKAEMTIHNYVHTGKPFDCDKCDKKFVTKNLLLKHQQTHDVNRIIYTCSYCSQRYFVKSKLKMHIEKNHSQ